MKLIKDILYNHINPHYITSDLLYGVEIEIEGERLPNQIISGWNVETDSSLKTEEAFEYVTKGPDTLEGIRQRLDILDSAFKKQNSIIYDSVRAGVHVHMNVQDWNIKQLMTFATCYYIIEDILLKWCGENREGNLFCLRTRDAEFVLFRLLDTLTNKNIASLNSDIIRYASLNYFSLFKYGTVEFRGMRSTGNLDIIYDWVRIIDELRTTSQSFDSPIEVIEHMSGDGELNFLDTLLPSMSTLFDYPDMDKLIRNAARRVQMLAFGVDWNELDKPQINIFKNGAGF